MIHDTLTSGNFTVGVGRQFIREIWKQEKGVVRVTSFLFIKPLYA
ncbi:MULTISPECIES: hypothetical protein [unclassified Microcoleus]